MTGGKPKSNDESFEAFQLKQNSKFENFMDQNANIDHAQFFTTAEPSLSLRTFLNKEFGGVMGSPMGWNPSVVEIDTGAIDIGRTSGKLAGFVIIQAETGTADDLTDINNFVFGYQDLTLLADAGDTITIKNTGNIDLSEDLVLDDSQAATFFYDIITNTWKVKGGIGDGGGTGLTEPVILQDTILTPLTAPTVTTVDWSVTNPQSITIDRNVEFDFTNFPASGKYEGVLIIIDIDATGGYDAPVWPAEVTNPPTVSTTALTRTSVMLYTIDGGTTVTHATSVGSSTGGGALLSNVVIDTNKSWLDFSISNLGGVSMSGDIDLNTFNITAIDQARFEADSTLAASSTDSVILLNSNSQFQINTAEANDFVWSFDNNAALVFDHDETTDPDQRVLAILSDSEVTDAVAFLQITHSAISPLDTQTIGALTFFGTDDAGGTGVLEYAALTAKMEETGTGVIAGSLLFDVTIAGVATPFLSFNNGGDGAISAQTHRITDVVDPTSAQDAATMNYVDSQTGFATVALDNLVSPTLNTSININSFDITNIDRATFADNGSSITASSITQMLLNSTGSFQTNTDTGNDFIWTINSITTATFSEDNILFRLSDSLISTLEIDGQDNALLTIQSPDDTGAAGIQLQRNDTDGGIPATVVIGSYSFQTGTSTASTIENYASIQAVAEVVTFGALQGSMDFAVQDGSGTQSEFMSINDGANGLIDMFTDLNINKVSSVAADAAILNLIKVDDDPGTGDKVGEISFNILDGIVDTVYGNIAVTWDATNVSDDSSRMDFELLTDDNLQTVCTLRGSAITDNLIALELAGESYIKAQSGVMGFFVTDDPDITDSGIIGDNGTMQMPTFSNSNPGASDLNAAFGSYIGAFGFNLVTSGASSRFRFYIKQTDAGSDGGWAAFDAEASVIG